MDGIQYSACPVDVGSVYDPANPASWSYTMAWGGKYSGNAHTRCEGSGGHPGVDIVPRTATSNNIYAIGDAEVIESNYLSGFGNYIILRHTIGISVFATKFYSIYLHLESIDPIVQKGKNIVTGQQIGIMGNSGGDWGVHLHFQIDGSLHPVKDSSGSILYYKPYWTQYISDEGELLNYPVGEDAEKSRNLSLAELSNAFKRVQENTINPVKLISEQSISYYKSVLVSNSIGSLNTIKISGISDPFPFFKIKNSITVSAWDVNGKALPESGVAEPLMFYSAHGTISISGSDLAARFLNGTPTLYKFSIDSSNFVITNVKNSMDGTFKIPIVYMNGMTNYASNSIGNYNTIKISDISGAIPASGSAISVRAWDANCNELTESGSAAPLKLFNHGTTSISGSTLAARFPTGLPMIYEFVVQSTKVLITNVKNSTDGNLNIPVAYISGVSNFVSNSIGNYNTLVISDLSGTIPSGVGTISVKAWDVNGNALTESGSLAPVKLYNHGTTSISGSNLAARFPTGKPMTYDFSIESSKVLITNVKSSTDGLVEIPSIFTSGISNYATNYVSSLNTIKISDMSGALPASGDAINITAWDTNGNVVLESGDAVPLKLQNLGTTIISGSDLAVRFSSGSPRMYEFSIGSSNGIVTSLTTSVDGTIKTPTVFTIGASGGI